MQRKTNIPITQYEVKGTEVGGKFLKKYEHWMFAMIVNFAKLGATQEQIAEFMNVNRNTVKEWFKTIPGLYVAVKNAKEQFDLEIINSMAHNAIGFSHEDTQFFMYKGQVIEKKYTKYYPPNVVAGIFWLKNRQGEKWQDQKDVNHKYSGTVNLRKIEDIPIEELSEEQQELIFNINMKQLKDGSSK
jgi:hypothetical protein